MRQAALNGYVEILQELRSVWDLTLEDSRFDNVWVLQLAASKGHALKEFRINWGMSADELRSIIFQPYGQL